jgi:hypothetical protein
LPPLRTAFVPPEKRGPLLTVTNFLSGNFR